MTTTALNCEKSQPNVSSTSSGPSRKRANKPLMEKRRRARINQSLADLRNLILDYLKKETTRSSKLEKADILETTLQYMRDLHRRQALVALVADPNVSDTYRAGWLECAKEVRLYMRANGRTMDPLAHQKIIGHLDDRCNEFSMKKAPATAASNQDRCVASPVPDDVPLGRNHQNRSSPNVTQVCTVRVSSGNEEMILLINNDGGVENQHVQNGGTINPNLGISINISNAGAHPGSPSPDNSEMWRPW